VAAQEHVEAVDEADAAGGGSDLGNKSVVKAAALLYELGYHLSGITVTDLAQRVGFSRPTAFRLLLSLEQTGFVEREGHRYRLGWKIARLGRLADPHGGIIRRLQPTLTELADQLQEAIGYAVVKGETGLDLITEETPKSRLFTLSHAYVGRDFPLHASAMGKLVLAELADDRLQEVLPETLPMMTCHTITRRSALIRALHEIRQQGYAVVDDELEESHFALAVAVRDSTSRLIGALAITGPGQRIKARPRDEIVIPLKNTALQIGQLLMQDG